MTEFQKILIIDDEPILLKILGKFLQKLEIPSETAELGEKGLELFKKEPFAFSYLFLDYNLPVLSPKEIISKIRALNPEIKIILSTGYSVEEVKKELEPIKIDGTLQKPYTFNDVKKIFEK